MQKRIVLDVRILESAAVVQQHDNGRDKTDVIETRPPEGRQNQSILKGHAHLFLPTKRPQRDGASLPAPRRNHD
jgi:hypothetical protein